MQLISPEVLIEARGLSPGASGFMLFVGILLWAFGWRWHRFWVVFGVTLAAGVLGLSAGRSADGQVLAIGVLLSVCAGMLALELSRIFSFLSGGTAAWVASSAMFPGAQELWVVFLCGGLLGVVLYRLWTMLATSFVGLLLCWHALLVMAEQFAKVDAPKIATDHAPAINAGLALCTLLGVLVQSWTGKNIGVDGSEMTPAAVEEESKPAKKKTPAHEPLTWTKWVKALANG